MIWRFLIYGLIGWGMEIVWTGLHSLLKNDFRMIGSTSIWMFPIYGMVIFLEPVYILIAGLPWVFRGGVYMICIFIAEYASGWSLQKSIGSCPWDYGTSKFSIKGLIRLDYAPVWFTVGILYERIYNFVLRVAW